MSKKRTTKTRGKSKGGGCLFYIVFGIIAAAVISSGQSDRSTPSPRSQPRATQQQSDYQTSSGKATPTVQPAYVEAQHLVREDKPTDAPLATNTSSSTAQNTDATATRQAVNAALTQMAEPTATIPNTPTRRPPTQAPPETYYTTGGANARSCASTECDPVTTLAAGTRVEVVGYEQGQAVSGNTTWRMVRHGGQVVYVHSSLLTTSAPQPTSAPVQVQSTAPLPQINQSAPSGFTCPRNCDGARAMGLTAEQAATCPGLDRDRDGVACYGD